MVEVTEHVRSATRVFVWNEELTKNQISESEGLCVIVFRRKFTRFDKDRDEEEELFSAVRSVTCTEFINDPYHRYSGGVLKVMYALRDYTGEAAICPTKPPFVPDFTKRTGADQKLLRYAHTPIQWQHTSNGQYLPCLL